MKCGVNRFILVVEGDGMKYWMKVGLKLVGYKKVKVIELGEGKDCNDVKKGGVMKLVYESGYECYEDLLKVRKWLDWGFGIIIYIS